MATRLEDEFDPTRINAPDAAYPAGSLKDETTPGVSDDGTPLASRVGNDWQGFSQSALDKAGIAANGQPDSVSNPQILQAIEQMYNDGDSQLAGGNIWPLSSQESAQVGDDLTGYSFVRLSGGDFSKITTFPFIKQDGSGEDVSGVLSNINLTSRPYSATIGSDDVYLLDINFYDKNYLSVKSLWAYGDGVTDDTFAFNAAVNSIRFGGLISMPTSTYKLSGTVLVPSNVEIDLNSSQIIGAGIGSSNNMFESAYIDINGDVSSNLGFPPIDREICIGISIRNGKIRETGICINIYYAIWQCSFHNLDFEECTTSIYADSCFYASFYEIITRGSAGGTLEPAYHFERAVNIQRIESVVVSERDLGFRFIGTAAAEGIYHCSAESCAKGMLIEGEINALTFRSCYFENLTEYCVNLDTPGSKFGVSFEGCFFNNASNPSGDAVALIISSGSVTTDVIRNVNVDKTCDFIQNDIDILDNSPSVRNIGEVHRPSLLLNYNTKPEVSDKLLFGRGSTLWNIVNCSDGSDSFSKSYVSGNSVIPFHYEGTAGDLLPGNMTFIERVLDTSNPSDVVVTYKTALQSTFSGMYVFNIKTSDVNNTYFFQGVIYGQSDTLCNIRLLSGEEPTKSISANVVNGLIEIEISGHETTVASDNCVVRHA